MVNTEGDLSKWRVKHPGIGVLAYPDELAAVQAAGTAGVVYQPGMGYPASAEPRPLVGMSTDDVDRLYGLVRAGAPLQLFGREYINAARSERVDRAREHALSEAVRLVCASGPPSADNRVKALPIADAFERYLLHGLEAATTGDADVLRGYPSTEDGKPAPPTGWITTGGQP